MPRPMVINETAINSLIEQYEKALKTIPGYIEKSPFAKFRTLEMKREMVMPAHERQRRIDVLRSPYLPTLVETAFWATMIPEEGRYHTFSLVFEDPSTRANAFLFDKPLPFSEKEIAKMAASLQSTDAGIIVWPEEKELCIRGFTTEPTSFFSDIPFEAGKIVSIRARQPGMLVVKARLPFDSFIAYMTSGSLVFPDLSNSPFRIAAEKVLGEPCPPIEDFAADVSRSERHLQCMNIITMIARAMKSHGHGGTMLIVPDNFPSSTPGLDLSDYSAKAGYTHIGQIVAEPPSKISPENALRSNAQRTAKENALRSLAQLTAVDGAAIITQSFTLYGFGAKIRPVDSNRRPNSYRERIPFLPDNPAEDCHITKAGGTRHQSAMQFVFDHPDAVAIVASQDGRLSVIFSDNGTVQMIRHADYFL
ncbi:MAG: hypothetical protein KF868_00190 [Acidobacteria bacterium]|nr:hypothetical protein [Acidobacteriota bacterium]MCW5969464.1 hypothetical protein [Blastocatellales bacterium]